jgi:putative oxidoreductase
MLKTKDTAAPSRFLDPITRPYGTTNTVLSGIALMRLMVGLVFVSEGIQKFLFPDSLGVGRFVHIGIPAPQAMAPFVGVTEIVCGSLIVLGLFARLACIPLIISMSVAIVTTKLPMLAKSGFWAMAHEARTDWSMILGLIFLLMVGAGKWSIDWRRYKKNHSAGVFDDR